MLTAILKKEFRQHAALWIALFLFVVVLQLLTAILYTLTSLGNVQKQSFVGIAVVISVLYAAGSAAIAFCNEHEEKTYTFLRALPIPPGKLLAGKLGWVVFSSVAFAVGTLLESFPWEAGFGNISLQYDETLPFLLACTVGLLYPISFGLFWSTWFKSQLHALLATFISGTAAVVFLVATVPPHGDGPSSPEEQALQICIVVLVTLIVGAVAVYRGYYWTKNEKRASSRAGGVGVLAVAPGCVDVLEKATHPGAYTPGSCADTPGDCAKRGEFLTLFVHAFRQSGGLFLCAVITGAIMFAVGVFTSVNTNFDHRYGVLVWLACCFSIVMGITFCGSVFSADQKNHGAFFAERGLSPGKVWWSRILSFGFGYFGVGLFLIAIPLFFGGVAKVFHPNHGMNPQFIEFLLWCIGLYVPVFIIGQLVSLVFRSGIVSIVLTGALTWVFFIWTALLTLYLGNGFQGRPSVSVAFAVGAPVLLGCLVASRLRIDDWLRGRSLWKSKRPVLTALLLPPLCVLAVIPPYRVYSIPYVDLGYRVDPFVLQEKITLQTTDPRAKAAFEDYWFKGRPDDGSPQMKAAKNAFNDPKQALVVYGERVYQELLWTNYLRDLPCEYVGEGQERFLQLNLRKDPESLIPKIDAHIAALQRWGKEKPSDLLVLKRVYEADYRFAKYGYYPVGYPDKDRSLTLWVFRFFPWERERVLRQLWNQFQLQSNLAEKIEKTPFPGDDYKSLQEMSMMLYDNLQRDSSFLTYTQFRLLSPHYGYLAWASNEYSRESTRRGRILQYALIKYRIEKGKLPESLEELKTVGYLDEIPRIPISEVPFYYDPHPDGSEPKAPWRDHRPGQPLLWAPEFNDVKKYAGKQLPWKHGVKNEMFSHGNFFSLNFTESE